MIRYIVMTAYPYEGLWPAEADGSGNEPLPTYVSEREAIDRAKQLKLISPKGRVNNAEILAIEVPE